MQNKTPVKKMLLIGDDFGPKAILMHDLLGVQPTGNTFVDPVYATYPLSSNDTLRAICLDLSDFDQLGTMAAEHYFPHASLLLVCPKDQTDLDAALAATAKYRHGIPTVVFVSEGQSLTLPTSVQCVEIPLLDAKPQFTAEHIHQLPFLDTPPSSGVRLFDSPQAGQPDHPSQDEQRSAGCSIL